MTEYPVPRKPAPWTTQCETYWFFVWLPRGELPKGAYAPLEGKDPNFSDPKQAGEFQGGLGAILVARYWDSPIGPYDELALMPGCFEVPGTNQSNRRITRIYVSQQHSVYNGRLNWNIPKYLARFSFSSPLSRTTTPESLYMAVYDPNTKEGDGVAPFFSATLRPYSLPSFPLFRALIPVGLRCMQPPLPKGDSPVLAGTDVWQSFTPDLTKSKCKIMLGEVHRPTEGSPEEDQAKKWWCPGLQPYSIGVWLEDAELCFD